jgi:hypothetical protein
MGREKPWHFQGVYCLFFLLTSCIIGMFGITGSVMISGVLLVLLVSPRRPALIESRETGLRALFTFIIYYYFKSIASRHTDILNYQLPYQLTKLSSLF